MSHRHGTGRSWDQRIIPHPLMTLTLIVLWLALTNDVSLGGLLLGTLLGLVIPIYTARLWPGRPPLRSPHRALAFAALVAYDIAVANVQVAYLVLFRQPSQFRTRWVAVPLELESPEGISVLMATITLTPGTISSDLSADGRTLLIHCLDVKDEQELVRQIKGRYERRIAEILP